MLRQTSQPHAITPVRASTDHVRKAIARPKEPQKRSV
jgi:hypothetical protein